MKRQTGGEMPNRCQPQVGFWVTIGSTTVITGDEEEHHRLTLKTDSSQDSSVVVQVGPEKMLKRSCGGKVWRTGRRSR